MNPADSAQHFYSPNHHNISTAISYSPETSRPTLVQQSLNMRHFPFTRFGSFSNTHATVGYVPNNGSAAPLALISQVDRSDDCIDYLIARTEMARRISIEESNRLLQALLAQNEMRPFPIMEQAPPYHSVDHISMSSNVSPQKLHLAPVSAPPDASSANRSSSMSDINDSPTGSVGASPTRRIRADLNSLWGKRYGQLVEYKETMGNCNVPQRYPANAELGRWVKDQRTFKAKGKLSQERIQLLDEIGFTWRLKCHEDFWDKRVKDLIDYKDTYGHCNVTMSNTNNLQLARWVDRQRRARKNGKISEERIQQLEKIGFNWTSR